MAVSKFFATKSTILAKLIVPILVATNPVAHAKNMNTDFTPYVNATTASASLTAQKTTAQTFINAYNDWDIEAIMDYRTPDCHQQPLPHSMGKPPKNNAQYREYFEKIMPLFSNFTVTVHKEFHDPEARMSFMHASSRADTNIGPYTNEYALSLSFTEDGTKITNIEEFVDSAYSAKFFAELAIPA
jgi:ketosteroid isomerase-like protein